MADLGQLAKESTDGEGGNGGKDFLFGAPGEAAEGAADADGAAEDAGTADKGPDGDSSADDTPAELTLDGSGDDADGGGDKPPPFNSHPAWKRLQSNLKDARRENAQLQEGRSTDEARMRELGAKIEGIEELYPDAGDDLYGAIQEDIDTIDALNRLIEVGDPDAVKLGRKILDETSRSRRGSRGRGRGGSSRSTGSDAGAKSSAADEERTAVRRERAEDLIDDLLKANGVTKFRGQIKKGALAKVDLSKRPTREAVLDAVNTVVREEGLKQSDISGQRRRRSTPPSGGTGRAAQSSEGGDGERGKSGGKRDAGSKRPKAKTAAEAQQNRRTHMSDLLKGLSGGRGSRT